jgi:WD40 repeat protein
MKPLPLALLLPLSVVLRCTCTQAAFAGPQEHDITYTATAFSPDGKSVLRAYFLPGVCALEYRHLDSRTPVYIPGPLEDYLISLAFEPGGKRALAGSQGNKLYLFDLEKEKLASSWEAHQKPEKPSGKVGVHHGVFALRFTSDGKRAWSFGADETVRLWEIASGKEIRNFRLVGHKEEITALDFSFDGKLAISGSYDGGVKVWDLSSEMEIRTLEERPRGGRRGYSSAVREVCFSPDARSALATNEEGFLEIWDATGGKAVQRIEVEPIPAHMGYRREFRAVFSLSGRYVLTWSPGWRDADLRLWEIATGGIALAFKQPDAPLTVDFAKFCPDRRTLLTTTKRGLVLWDLPSGKSVRRAEGP